MDAAIPGRTILDHLSTKLMLGPETTKIEAPSRAPVACDVCASKKQRCHGGNPCYYCQAKQIPCTFAREIVRKGPRIANLKKEKLRLEGLLKEKQALQAQALAAITPRQSTPPSPVVHANIHEWTCFTFYCLMLPLPGTSGSTLPFLDFYFDRFTLLFSFLDKDWVSNHLGDVPMVMLHAMYALCLAETADEQQARQHYQYSHHAILNGLDAADPFVVFAALNLLYTSSKLGMAPSRQIAHLTIATSLSIAIDLANDKVAWYSRVGTLLHLPRFTTGMARFIASLENQSHVLFGVAALVAPS
ncbi:hypothetical protein HDU91_007193 [Kappamyces sp. JEL0680]|nr:hypothetical protein HDU91_007193 [Kappamyces sp. JEL0680]